MTGEPWSWRCEKCERLLHWDDLLRATNGQRQHWDLLRQQWCGPVKQVTVR